MMYTAPCKGCKDRVVGCHSTCRDYIEYKVNHERELKIIKKEKNKDCLFQEYASKRAEFYLKRRGMKPFEK